MTANVPVIRFLDEERCRALLATASVGRVAAVVNGVPHVVPVNFVLVDGDVVFRSGSGTKLHAALQEQPVSFEVDRIDEATQTGWSVLVSGTASVVSEPDVLGRAELGSLEMWAPGTRDEVVRVRSDLVSGREISRP
jgi:nitroimidazol reductase NimA-like FMN-containing flavoprotein (pyridoxamine 5'-phosphate oxidase superfamily)